MGKDTTKCISKYNAKYPALRCYKCVTKYITVNVSIIKILYFAFSNTQNTTETRYVGVS